MSIPLTPEQASKNFAKNLINKGFLFEALHEYTDHNGNSLYWRIRLKHPETGDKWIRPMTLIDGKYLLREPNQEHGKVLYRLHDLIQQPLRTVIICEGEKCADVLNGLGLLATTTGSAQSTSKIDWMPLAKRNLIIWPDNDSSGQQYAQTIIEQLKPLDCNIKLVDITKLNLKEKGDVVDWLNVHPEATTADIMALPLLDLPELTQEESAEEKQNQTTALTTFVIAHTILFHDKNHDVYAQDTQTKETRRLDSRQFRDWLYASFFEKTGKVPRDQAYRECLSVLSGQARHKGELKDVYIRVGKYQDIYYLDLGERGNSRAIEINASYWKIINESPIFFLRPDSLQPLPEPIEGGDINQLWKLINIPKDNQLLIIAWLCECLRPDTPFPILELIGEQGSAKSTTQAILRKLIDENSCNLRGAPKTIEDIFVTAGVNWLMSYENISHLSPPMQDTLCILSTGGGFAKRKLYSDADEAIINVQRPIILNGISIAVTAQDLVDRTLTIEMPTITVRTETTDLWRLLESERPKLLGALLDIMVRALSLLPTIEIAADNRPRLLEFARFGMAISEAMQYPSEVFLEQFKAGREEAIARTIDSSPVATALIDWLDQGRSEMVRMPINKLFKALEDFKPTYTEAWPRSAKGFGDALRRAAPALRQIGIECRSLGKIGSNVQWEISKKEK